ncbi:MAG: hypothetical protein ABJE95_11240 [Byssovorax sp.]
MNPSFLVGAGLGLIASLAVIGCGHRAGPAPAGSTSALASTAPVASAAPIPSGSAAAPPDTAAVVAFDPPAGAASVTELTTARSNKLCRAQTAEIAAYQSEGVLALGAGKGGVGAAWLVHLAGKREEQIAFSAFDPEGKPTERPRGVGLAGQKIARVFGSGSGFTVAWFDANALAYARPRAEPLPPPEIGHLSMFGPEVAGDVALSATDAGSVVAAAPFGAGKNQLGLFQFSPAEEGAPPVTALGVTHHAVAPSRPAVAGSATATFVAWFEADGRILASRFDAKGKESDAACVVAPAAADKRDHLALAAVGSGVIALWMEGSTIRTRALDGSGCPISPAWKVGEGRSATLSAVGETAVVAWLTTEGRLLAAKLGAAAAPPAAGLDIADGALGIKDPPALAVTSGRLAFGWAEVMSPVVSTRRLMLRLIDVACLP